MIAIHKSKNDFSQKWIEYCETNQIDYKIVNCYSTDIMKQVQCCDALMWHFNQSSPKDILFAKELIFALETAGKKVFPNFNTAWHFDDKLGQKYLLEAIDVPFVTSYVFYNKQKALEWANKETFPKVFKLRKGAGSQHVKLVSNINQARKIIKKAFGRGFNLYDKWYNLKDRWYKYNNNKKGFGNVIKGVLRFFRSPEFARVAGREKGYVYFQDFISKSDYDIRVIVIGGKAFAIKRMVRKGDFRASGSGHVLYEKKHFNEKTIRLSFDVAKKIKSQCLAIDYVYKDGNPMIVELSFGFIKEVYYPCEGYWDRNLKWHSGPFNAQGWMVENLLNSSSTK